MKLLTTLVKRAAQIEVGSWYVLRGHAGDGLVIPPQVFFVRQKNLFTGGGGIPLLRGDLYFVVDGQPQCLLHHEIPLVDVNIPEHGVHDIHLEKIDDIQSGALRKDYSVYRDATAERRHTIRPITDFSPAYKPYIG